MNNPPFVINKPVTVEESRLVEFKEVKGANPIDAIKNTADEYVVAFLNSEGGRIYWGIRDSDRTVVGVRSDARQRDEIRRVVADKLGQIQPSISPTAYRILFHEIHEAGEGVIGNTLRDLFVVEIVVPKASASQLYFTGSSMAFVKTDAGKKRLTGAELNDEMMRRLHQNQTPPVLPKTDAPDHQKTIEMLEKYESQLRTKVSSIKILGSADTHPLDKAFVKLSISEQYDPRQGDTRHLSFLNTELRRLQTILVQDGNDSKFEQSLKEAKLLSPDELLMRPTHALITGAPGCGKTTVLRYLTYQLLQAWNLTRGLNFLESSEPHVTGILPIFLELKQLTEESFDGVVTLENLLFEAGILPLTKPRNTMERAQLQETLYSFLERGHIAVFLDGLDEISGAGFFPKLERMISTFLHSPYGINSVVISSRPFAIRQLGDSQIMEIEPLTEAQMEQFIGHYFSNTIRSFDFLDHLKHRRDLRELARSPALLGFLVLLWRDDRLKDQTKLGLYERVSQEQALQLDHEKEGVLPERKWLVADADGSLKRDFLRFLAFETLFTSLPEFDRGETASLSGGLVFSASRLLAIARTFAKRIAETEGTIINPRDLAEDVKVTVLLRHVGRDKYAFSHLTLHEYLAARELAEREDAIKIVCRAYFDPMLSAMEVLPMAMGLSANAKELFQAIDELPESLSLARMHLLSRSLDYQLTTSDDSIRSLRDQLVNFIKAYALDFEKAEMFESYAWLKKYPAHRRSFAALLKNGDAECRERVAIMLGLVGGEEVVPDLLECLSHSEGKLRSNIILALGHIGDSRATPILSRLIDEDPEHYGDYWRALKQLGVERSRNTFKVERVQELIRRSALDPTIKRIFIRDLNEQGLTEELKSQIRAYCLEGMRILDVSMEEARKELNARERGLLDRPDSISDTVRDAWENRDPELRERALALLEESGKADELVAIMETDMPLEIGPRKRVIQSIARIGGTRSVVSLMQALGDASSEVRWVARKGLAQLNPHDIRSGLMAALTHEVAFVRAEAAKVIPYYISDSAQPLSNAATTDPDSEVRGVATESLKRGEQKLRYFS